VYRRSLSSGPEPKAEAFNCETRKDSAVHVSLSSSSLVKQPGPKTQLPSLEVHEALIGRQITTDGYRLLIRSTK
jgi:hypothetical protein